MTAITRTVPSAPVVNPVAHGVGAMAGQARGTRMDQDINAPSARGPWQTVAAAGRGPQTQRSCADCASSFSDEEVVRTVRARVPRWHLASSRAAAGFLPGPAASGACPGILPESDPAIGDAFRALACCRPS
jgi:hypothetical protein